VCIELRQTQFMDGYREQPFLFINGEEVSTEAAIRLATGLASTIAEANAR
jgi:hypothetical protein